MAAKKRPAGKASAKHSATKAKAPSVKRVTPAARKSVAGPPSKRPARTAKSSGAASAAKKPKATPAAPPARKAAPALAPVARPQASLTTQVRKPAPRILPPPRGVTAGRRADSRPLKSSVGLIHGIEPYQPKPGEQYMNERQLEHFRQILLAWKRELMEEVDRTVHHMQDEASNFPDPNDRATQESEFGLELRTRDRERKLLKKIDSAIERIDSGTYGYCEETGEEIGLRRLEARPVATLSVEAQERREVAERQFRDREDGH